MTKREHFVQVVESLRGKPSLWGQKGPDAFDCSGVVTFSLKQVGGPDRRFTHNSHALHDDSRELVAGEKPLAGDLAFYGNAPDAVTHVAIVDVFGGVISADGATSHVTSLAVSMANPANRIRRHRVANFRKDLPYHVVRRFTLLDDLDKVSK